MLTIDLREPCPLVGRASGSVELARRGCSEAVPNTLRHYSMTILVILPLTIPFLENSGTERYIEYSNGASIANAIVVNSAIAKHPVPMLVQTISSPAIYGEIKAKISLICSKIVFVAKMGPKF